MKKMAAILLILTHTLHAQKQYDIDSSYTPKSVYDKEKKAYPFISLPQPKSYPGLQQKTEIVYTQIGERKLHLDSYFFPGTKQNPALVILHGGGWKSGNKTQMQGFAQEMATKGFSCFTIEYRLSTEAQYPAAIFDVKKAIRYIKTNATLFNVNPTEIAIVGCSSGGQMAALIGSTNQNKKFEEQQKKHKINSTVQAIIDIDGILAFKHPESNEGAIAAQWLGGNYNQIPSIWEEASALTHTNKNCPPILFINSSKERFHAGRNDMIAILEKNKIYYDVKTLENSPHSFWFLDPWFEPTIAYTTAFLNTVFKKTDSP